MVANAFAVMSNALTPSDTLSLSADAETIAFKEGIHVQTGMDRIDLRGRLFANSHAGRTGTLFDAMGRYQLQMFGAQTNPSVNLNGLVASYNPATQNSGAALQFHAGNHWKVSTAYFNTRPATDTEVPAPDHQQADIWNMAASRSWFRERVTTRLEYAHSRHQLNDDGGDSNKDSADSAIDTQLNIASKGLLDLPLIGAWRAGLLHQSVGEDFHNLGERLLPVGLTQTQLFFTTSIKNIDVELGWHLEDQARENPLALPARETERTRMMLTYAPQISDTNLFGQLINATSFNTRFSNASQRQPDFRAQGEINPLLSEINEVGLGFRFSQPYWYWGLQYQQTDLNNRLADDVYRVGAMAPVSDWANNSTILELGLDPISRLSLNLNMQWHQQYEQERANEYYRQHYEITARYQLIPRICNLSMRYNYGRNFSELSNINATNMDIATQFADAQLSWRAIAGAGSHPAMDIYLQSHYGQFDNRTVLAVDEKWSARLGVKFYWSDSDRL